MTPNNHNPNPGFDLTKLNINADDKPTIRLLMLIEGTYGIGVKESIKKYGFTEPGFYQVKKRFMTEGFEGLIDQKRGPRTKHKRTEAVDKMIIRMRFLDPDCSAAVITQKLKQQGVTISQRTVERTITEFALQKKTLQAKSSKSRRKYSGKNSKDKTQKD